MHNSILYIGRTMSEKKEYHVLFCQNERYAISVYIDM